MDLPIAYIKPVTYSGYFLIVVEIFEVTVIIPQTKKSQYIFFIKTAIAKTKTQKKIVLLIAKVGLAFTWIWAKYKWAIN